MSTILIESLRRTAARLRDEAPYYRWTHQGACNCGHLVQTLTKKSRREIHEAALQKAGDWREHAIEYCPTSGYPIDHIIGEMLAVGMTLDEIEHLERLSDPRVLRRLPAGERGLDFRRREDAIRYMEAWADLLEERQPPPARAA